MCLQPSLLALPSVCADLEGATPSLKKTLDTRVIFSSSNCFVFSAKVQNWIFLPVCDPEPLFPACHPIHSGPLNDAVGRFQTSLLLFLRWAGFPSRPILPLGHSAVESFWSRDTGTLINSISQKKEKIGPRNDPHCTANKGSTLTRASSSPPWIFLEPKGTSRQSELFTKHQAMPLGWAVSLRKARL